MSCTSKDKEAAEVEEEEEEEEEAAAAKQKQKHNNNNNNSKVEEEGVVKISSRGFSGATKFSDYRKTVITSPTTTTTESKEEKSKDGKLVIKSRGFVAENSSEEKKYEDYAYGSDEGDESNDEGSLTRFVKHLQDEIIEVAGDAKDFLKRSLQ